MAIYRTKAGIWVIQGDSLRTPWVEQRGSLYVDALIGEISKYIAPGDTVVDVGANIGDHTFFYCEKAGKDGVVYAFEPDFEAFACLVLNCGWRPTFFEAAALDEERTVGLRQHDNRGQNYVLMEGDGIRGFPIDSLNLARCDLIKIDVEGAEMKVLRGATRTIEMFRPVIAIELIEEQLRRFQTSKLEVIDFLDKHGYTLHPLRSSESLEDSRVDAICLPVGRAAEPLG